MQIGTELSLLGLAHHRGNNAVPNDQATDVGSASLFNKLLGKDIRPQLQKGFNHALGSLLCLSQYHTTRVVRDQRFKLYSTGEFFDLSAEAISGLQLRVDDPEFADRVGRDVVGRLGGDEFGVILAQADEASAAEKAALLAAAVQENPLVWEQHRIVLSVSYGAYSFRGSEDAGDALHAADRAMYEHKREAGGRS